MRGQGLRVAAADITLLLDDRVPPVCWEGRLAGVAARFGNASVKPDARPLFSVVVPAHQAADGLERTLDALCRSDLPRESWELIVVDDASSDDTSAIAGRFADVIVRLPGDQPFGPAYARNRGADIARGEILVFIDADVRVRPDTLSLFGSAFADDPEVSAVIGCYDGTATSPDVVSRYRNLLHHYMHQRNAGTTDMFWGGCGAVRRTAFVEAGGYDEWSFARQQVEDIELGHRLRAAGRTIVLRPEIQATHLKQWTLGNLLATDIWDQGVPWVRVVSERAGKPDKAGVDLRTIERVNAGLAWLALGAAIVSAVQLESAWLWAALGCVTGVALNNRAQLAFFWRKSGAGFTMATIALDSLCYLVSGVAAVSGWLLREIIGEPTPDPVTQAYFEVGASQWPPVRAKRSARQKTSAASPATGH